MNAQIHHPGVIVPTTRCPLDPSEQGRAQDFLFWWKRGANLIGREAFPMLTPTACTLEDLQLASMPHVLKHLNSLDIPRRVLLLTMACLANPGWATWLQREKGLHYGHLNAAHLGDQIFQVVVGLLASHSATTNN